MMREMSLGSLSANGTPRPDFEKRQKLPFWFRFLGGCDALKELAACFAIVWLPRELQHQSAI